MGQRNCRLFATSCSIWLLTVALASGQDSPDTAQLRQLASEGDADAQFDLGVMYANGEDVPKKTRAKPSAGTVMQPTRVMPVRNSTSATCTTTAGARLKTMAKPSRGTVMQPSKATHVHSTTLAPCTVEAEAYRKTIQKPPVGTGAQPTKA